MTGRRVLIVDDAAASAKITARLWELLGHDVAVANTGQSALDQSRTFHPEIVVLDVSLPDMDGFEVARRLRQLVETKGALIVALTGHGEESYRRRAEDAGFDEYLVKPTDANAFRMLAAHAKLADLDVNRVPC